MYTVLVETRFTASHQITMHDGTKEPLHEHQWKVDAAVTADQLDDLGLGIDFNLLQSKLHQIMKPLDGKQLEKTEFFKDENTSAEHVARFFYEKLSSQLPPGRKLAWIEVTEAPGCRVRYNLE